MSDSEISLRDFMELRFASLEKEVAQLREVITGDLKTLKTRQNGTEDRLLVLENTLAVYRYIGGLIVGVILLLVGAWLRQTLGL